MLLSGGETTVTVNNTQPKRGRNTEFYSVWPVRSGNTVSGPWREIAMVLMAQKMPQVRSSSGYACARQAERS